MSRRPPTWAAALVAALAVLLAACSPTTSTALTSPGLPRQADGWHGLPMTPARDLPDVTLEALDGTPFALADELRGTPTLLFFGYTSCPDVCPIHLAALTSAMRQAGVTFGQVDVVFVTVDPERDTPERIADYLANFDRRITGLWAPEEVVEETLHALALSGPRVEGPDPRGGDLIGHPAQVIGFDAQGRGQRVWPFGVRRADWIGDLPRIVGAWS